MTNQDKFIETFGIDAWRQMISFSGIAEQFKEFWTSKYEKPEHTGIDFISDLDKIRAEIALRNLGESSNICIKAYNDAINDILQIIDKYKAESEVDNG